VKYDAIENGIADVSDPMLKERVTKLRVIATRPAPTQSGPRVRSIGSDRASPPQALKTFARQARKGMRTEGGGYRRDHLRALAQRVEVDAKEVRIMGSKSALLRTLVAASSAKTAGFGVPSLYALPERRVTVHSGDMGYTIGPFARSARCPGRRVTPWMSV